MRRRRIVDKVRASRDGHEFHEAWTARKAMQLLLWPDSGLTAIAVEGLSPVDQAGAAAATVEVADLTFYHGGLPQFRGCHPNDNYPASNTPSLITTRTSALFTQRRAVQKFGATYRSFKHKYGAQAVEDKLDFQLVTNQPIANALIQAIEATSTGSNPIGDAKRAGKAIQDRFRSIGKTTGSIRPKVQNHWQLKEPAANQG